MRSWGIALVLAIAGVARAATTVCLETRADTDPDGFRRLVEEELAHHPSHHQVTDGCASHLAVELFTVAGNRFLTARINQEVPVRFAVKHDLDEKLSEGLRQVLQHDPVYLSEDLSRMNAVWRAGSNVIRRGVNRYRLEAFEIIGNGGKNAVFASGAAFAVTRGIDHWQVFARLEAAGSSRNYADDIVLRVMAGGELGVFWEASARANTTFYIGPGVALDYLRFEGRAGAPVDSLLFSLVARAGVRFLRFSAVDVDVFVQGNLPFYKTSDPDSKLVDAYTPYLATGLGVGF